MSEAVNHLLVDAGNSNVKSCVVLSDDTLTVLKDPLDNTVIFTQYSIKRVVLASVRNADYSQRLQQYCAVEKIPFTELETEAEVFGTRCAYKNYKTLGVDRWMMILAAAQRAEESILVLSIGTAMTVDFVHQGQHIGGWITPGFDLAKHALFQNTQQVFGNDEYPKNNQFGDGTEACVNYGCRAQVNGLLEEALRVAKHHASHVKVLVCGGGIGLLDFALFDDLEVDEHLIFKGIKRFI